MSDETTTIQTGMKWDVLLSAVGMKCEGNGLKTNVESSQLFYSIKNPVDPTPPYSKTESADETDGTNPNEGNSNTTETNTSKGE